MTGWEARRGGKIGLEDTLTYLVPFSKYIYVCEFIPRYVFGMFGDIEVADGGKLIFAYVDRQRRT